MLRSYDIIDWTWMHIWTGIISMTAWPCFFFIPESPRWLAINGNSQAAADILYKIAKRNGKTITMEEKKGIEDVLHGIDEKSKQEDKDEQLSPLDMVRGGYLRTTAIMLFNWVKLIVRMKSKIKGAMKNQRFI